jgi:selenocysteine lyase/cysteine desulfurase
MGEVWPEAQRHVARELGTDMPEAIVFGSNTHDFLVRLFAAAPRTSGEPLRVLTSDGEFHSARRQLARWEESGETVVERVPAEPFDSFSERFFAAARTGRHDLILVSHVLFGSGRTFAGIDGLAGLASADRPWVVIDGYHAFMALERPLEKGAARSAFYLGGGYKYAMAGEGCAFLHAPPHFAARPPITGWFAEFEDLTLAPGLVGYARDASRFMGATFDPSGLYRFNAVQRMLRANSLSTARISAHVADLQGRLLEAISGTSLGRAELLNPPSAAHARFLAFRTPDAQRWCAELLASNCVADVRGDVLRIGLGLYHDVNDVQNFSALTERLN